MIIFNSLVLSWYGNTELDHWFREWLVACDLNQCWLIHSEVLWYSPEGNFTGTISIITICCKITHSNLPCKSNVFTLVTLVLYSDYSHVFCHVISIHSCRDHFVYAPNQWEKTLQCNVISHWLGAHRKLTPPLAQWAKKKSCNCHKKWLHSALCYKHLL